MLPKNLSGLVDNCALAVTQMAEQIKVLAMQATRGLADNSFFISSLLMFKFERKDNKKNRTIII